MVGMANEAPHLNSSSWYITLDSALPSLDNKHTLFGYVAEDPDSVL